MKHKLNNLRVIYFIPKEFQKDFKLLNFFVPDTTGFFVKHVQTGMCINDTSIIYSKGSWGNMSFLQLSNNCLDPAAQFRFVDTSAMLNLKRPGCLFPLPGNNPYWLALWVASFSEIKLGRSCNDGLAINQTSWGGILSTKYSRCAERKTDQRFAGQGISSYIGLNQDCNDNQNRRFNFGKILVSSHTLPFCDIKQKLYTVYEIKCSLMNKKNYILLRI